MSNSNIRGEIELAWAAGFFDGEGSVRWARNTSGRGTFTIQISQLDRETLDRFMAAVGVGKIHGPYTNGKRNNRAAYIYSWRQSGSLGVTAFNAMRPYLSSIKRAQGDAALLKHQENLIKRRKLAANNTSGYPNIVWQKRTSKWVAYCTLSKQRIHIGTFSDKEEAYRAQQLAMSHPNNEGYDCACGGH